MNSTVRWVLAVTGAAGVLFSLVGFVDIIEVIRTNGVTDGEPVGLRQHYLQLGRFYARGFTTGFFLCFSLMLVAIAVGTWYDERRKARREKLGAALVARQAPRRPLLAGEDDPDHTDSTTH